MRLFHAIIFMAMSLLMTACDPKSDVLSAAENSPYFTGQDQFVSVDGLGVRYREEGPRDGPAIIMVHGFTSSLETWDLLAAELKDEYRVIRMDLPGHGLTGPDPQGRYTNEDTVRFLAEFIDALNVEKPVLVGNSLGGLVSWRLAATSSEALSGLILISPGGFSINGVTDKPVEVPLMVEMYLTKAPMAGIKRATTALYADPEKLTEARINSVRDMMLWPGNGEAFVARAASFTLPDPTDDLSNITVPTLIVWGDKDVMVPLAHGSKFVAALPNAKLKIYENTGHVPQEEMPEKLASDFRGFLLTLEAQ